MKLGAQLRARRHSEAIAERRRSYLEVLETSKRLAFQLNLWNQEWQRILDDVPYYQALASRKNLPSKFSCWEQFFESFQVVHRHDIQQHGQAMASDRRAADFYRTTGGSTAEPLKIPGWKSEADYIWPNFWWALTWHGVNLGSRQFLLWGRSHTLGSGLKGVLERHKRRLFDYLLGIHRCSAYDLSQTAMRQAALALIRARPDYVYGYSVALDQFARANLELRDALRKCGIKVVFGTAESFPAPDSMPLLQDLFNCPVVMEYGSVETGAMAFTNPTDYHYRVFWRQYFLEAEKRADPLGWRLRVTSLYPRCFPLIRYDLGDEIELSNSQELFYGLDSFNKVIGRCNAYVELTDGAAIHSEAFTHAVKIFPKILAFQVQQENKKNISISYIGTALSSEEIVQIQQRLKKIHPLLGDIPLVNIDALQQTVAGKTPMVIKK